MKIALLADIHGNSIALDAVLADVETRGGVDAYWLLGDYAAIGYDPIGVLERIARLPNAHCVRGNTERYLVTGERPIQALEEIQTNPRLLPKFAQVTASFAWTGGAVATAGWLGWFADLPLEQRLILPDGTRMLAVHASPGSDDGRGICPNTSDRELEQMTTECAADLVCVGHRHWVIDRQIGHVRYVNPGSVSNPFPPDLRASYAILHADNVSYRIEQRRVEYNREAVVAAIERVRHPAASYLIGFMRGEHLPPWMRNANR